MFLGDEKVVLHTSQCLFSIATSVVSIPTLVLIFLFWFRFDLWVFWCCWRTFIDENSLGQSRQANTEPEGSSFTFIGAHWWASMSASLSNTAWQLLQCARFILNPLHWWESAFCKVSQFSQTISSGSCKGPKNYYRTSTLIWHILIQFL